jgi:hypothetical protein
MFLALACLFVTLYAFIMYRLYWVLGYELDHAKLWLDFASKLLSMALTLLGVTLVLQLYEAERWKGADARVRQRLRRLASSLVFRYKDLLMGPRPSTENGDDTMHAYEVMGYIAAGMSSLACETVTSLARLMTDTAAETRAVFDDFGQRLSPVQYATLLDIEQQAYRAEVMCGRYAEALADDDPAVVGRIRTRSVVPVTTASQLVRLLTLLITLL